MWKGVCLVPLIAKLNDGSTDMSVYVNISSEKMFHHAKINLTLYDLQN
jgi:hypothetical protein